MRKKQTMDHIHKKKQQQQQQQQHKKITIEQHVIENEQDRKIRIKVLLLTC